MKKVAHSLHNPNVAAGYATETNDCAVRAMANSFGVSYAYAHQAMKTAGRKDKKVTPVSVIEEVITKEHGGKVAVQIPTIGQACLSVSPENRTHEITIATFCKQNPHGRFYCLVRGHALAIVDGVVQDSFRNKAGKRIYKAYEIV